ncbi:transcriptional regulator [Sulfolobales archaeon HS-7]|nr:transcriptional regulator [Sulfolobales archaeon HS-7]
MRRGEELYCEMCGRKTNNVTQVNIEGATLSLCDICYNKVKSDAKVIKQQQKKFNSKKMITRRTIRDLPEEDIIENYGQLIREGRERLHMTTKQLADKMKVQENIVKRFESGKLRPTLEQAKSLEKILNISLITKNFEEGTDNQLEGNDDEFELTLGDIVNIRNKVRKN